MKNILNVKNTNKSKSNMQLRVTFNQIFLQVKKKHVSNIQPNISTSKKTSK